MATGPIETHLHRSFNWENGAPGPREGQRGRSARCGNGLFAQCVRLRSEINQFIHRSCDVNRSDSAIPPEGCDYSQCPATSTTQCLPVACCS